MQILNERQISQKVRRLAIQILENNYKEKEIILAGINNNGMHFAELLVNELLERTEVKITLTRIRLNPAKPLKDEVILEMPLKEVRNKVIILVDDVANTGRTIFYATKPLMEVLPKKVEVAVLVDRKHKSFPIRVDYVGLSLATTLKEHIDVQIREVEEVAVYLS
jgi:pyrimidine operon attenuation protein/uracil phosphoribosyltransferase